MFCRSIKLGEVTYDNVCQYFKGKILTGHFQCRSTNMQASGIPNHLQVIDQIRVLQEQVVAVTSKLTETNEKVVEAISNAERIIRAEMGLVPEKVRDCILENFNVQGAIPVTMSTIHALFEKHNADILDKITEIRDSIVESVSVSATASGVGDVTGGEMVHENSRVAGSYRLFQWGGRLGRMVPSGFKFPSCDIKTLWDLWYFGKSSEGIRPYRHLDSTLQVNFHADLTTKDDRENFSRAKRVIVALTDHICERKEKRKEEFETELQTFSISDSDELYEQHFPSFISKFYENGNNKSLGLNYTTLANRMYARNPNKRRRKQND